MTEGYREMVDGNGEPLGENDCHRGHSHRRWVDAQDPGPRRASPSRDRALLIKPREVRVSADASVLYIDAFTCQDKSRYFIDIVNGLTYSSTVLNLPKKTMWVFDDMLIGLTESGLTAFVPASS